MTVQISNFPAQILITDDEPDLREMLQEYLVMQGCGVFCASDANQARDIVAKQSFDLAILDVRMPGEDGMSLARHLREHYNIGIILLIAADESMDKILGLEIGADDYLVKPFDPRELLARIKSLLRRTRSVSPIPAINDHSSIDIRIARLRKKIEPAPENLRYSKPCVMPDRYS